MLCINRMKLVYIFHALIGDENRNLTYLEVPTS